MTCYCKLYIVCFSYYTQNCATTIKPVSVLVFVSSILELNYAMDYFFEKTNLAEHPSSFFTHKLRLGLLKLISTIFVFPDTVLEYFCLCFITLIFFTLALTTWLIKKKQLPVVFINSQYFILDYCHFITYFLKFIFLR